METPDERGAVYSRRSHVRKHGYWRNGTRAASTVVQHRAVSTPKDPRPPPARVAPSSVALVYCLRGGRVESLHRGAFVLSRGARIVASAGSSDRRIFGRSTLKPFQTLAGYSSGAWKQFELSDRDLAIASASHNGESEHTEAVKALLAKADIPARALGCGGHWSIAPSVARSQTKPDDGFPPIASNCSGKHAMMLAIAKAMDAPLDGYVDPEHNVQQLILEHVAACTGTPQDEIALGIDGCGAPVHRVSLRGLARALSGLASPDHAPATLAEPLARIQTAMTTHAFLVAGTHRFDTALMQATKGRVVAKVGAEGVYGVAIREHGMGLAVKVDDGHDRGFRRVVLEILRHLEVLQQGAFDCLAARYAPTILTNHAGKEVGEMVLGIRL